MSDKRKALEMALNQIERQFGKGSVMQLGEDAAKLNVEVIQQEHYPWILPLVWEEYLEEG